ncbi:hypothetical protein TFUB22_00081 [Tannerella forsythia]|nr:hypothetical protein TFUB22_00081 [Tannerella forsythia]
MFIDEKFIKETITSNILHTGITYRNCFHNLALSHRFNLVSTIP